MHFRQHIVRYPLVTGPIPPHISPNTSQLVSRVSSFTDGNSDTISTAIYLNDARYKNISEVLSVISGVLSLIHLGKYVKISIANNRVKIRILHDEVTLALDGNLSKLLGFDERQIDSLSSIVTIAHLPLTPLHPHDIPVRIFTSDNRWNTSTNEFDSDIFVPSTIKILIPQLKPSIDGSIFTTLANVVPGPKKNDGSIFSTSPLVPIVIAPNTNSLNEMRVILTDGNTGKQLKLTIGSATYVHVRISRSIQEMNHQIITCFSNDKQSKHHHPSNTSTNFIIQLPQHLVNETGGDWALQLLSFSMTSKVRNITSDIAYIDVSHSEVSRINLQPGYYKNIESFIAEINMKLNIGDQMRNDGGTNPATKIIFSLANDGRIQITNNGRSNMRLKLPPILAMLLGYQTETDNAGEILLRSRRKESFIYYPNIDAARPRYIKILCRQIKPTYFGGHNEHVLGFFSIDSAKTNSKVKYYEFLKPQSHIINSQYLSQIQILISPGNSSTPLEVDTEMEDIPSHLVLSLVKSY